MRSRPTASALMSFVVGLCIPLAGCETNQEGPTQSPPPQDDVQTTPRDGTTLDDGTTPNDGTTPGVGTTPETGVNDAPSDSDASAPLGATPNAESRGSIEDPDVTEVE